ncbi:MAG TPA: hypothetical protein VL356_10670, partial [Acidocella sp.]|nr:hypothetical protein [Acidocella sp.]
LVWFGEPMALLHPEQTGRLVFVVKVRRGKLAYVASGCKCAAALALGWEKDTPHRARKEAK